METASLTCRRQFSANTVTILAGKGRSIPTHAASLWEIHCALRPAIEDFNGDHVPDLAVADFGINTVSILLGKGAGNSSLQSTTPSGSVQPV